MKTASTPTTSRRRSGCWGAARAARRPSRHQGGQARGVAHVQGAQGASGAPASGRPSSPHDRAVTERPRPGRRCASTTRPLGIPLVSTAPGAFAGELINPRGCYICKNDYTLVDAFYHWLCPSCAAMSHAKRDQGTDLHRTPRAAHRRPRQDRHVHRAAAAARRRAHHDHDPLPARRRPPLLGAGGQRRLDATGSRSSASTCATRPRWSRSPTRSRPPARSTS